MFHGRTVGVVVPAYNEERFVGTVVRTLPAFVDRAYIVDDCSTDGTWNAIIAAASEVNGRVDAPLIVDGGQRSDARVVPIRCTTNQGRGAATKTGYRHAISDGLDVVAVMDGDGQMDPDILDAIITPVVRGEADYTVGNRLGGRSQWKGMSLWRLFGNTLLTGLTRIASGYWHLRDPQNGYTCISGTTLASLDLDSLYDRYGFLNDLLVTLHVEQRRVVNVPMRARYGDEESGIRYASFVPELSLLLLRNFLWRLRVTYLSRGVHPLVLLYALGVMSLFAGLLGVGRTLLTLRAERGNPLLFCLAGVGSLLGAMLWDKHETEDYVDR